MGKYLWVERKVSFPSKATECAQGDTVPDTERFPDTYLDPGERTGTLQQRLLKRAGCIHQTGWSYGDDREAHKGPGSVSSTQGD